MAGPNDVPRPLSATAAKKQASLARRLAALEARRTMSPSGPATERFRVGTWNLNSLRARLPAVIRFLERVEPDAMCLQETKATDVSDEAMAAFSELGYGYAHVGAGSYNGVTIIARHPIVDVERSGAFGNEVLDREPRLISCVIDAGRRVRIASTYVPHGRSIGHWHFDYKLAFLEAMAVQVERWLMEGHLILGGDVNVAPTNSDIFHPDAFVGLTHVTGEERDALARVLAAGLVDLDARRWGPEERRFTWWNHGLNYSRNLGMRIDLLASDAELADCLDTTWIDHVERGGER
ncbi:MAG: exodeoxyribonuclease, partial [Ilumatobacteraceae bacterium]|nr:exodeoxyribonuclease [Ilumatobacteraceae bacterium]